ncbi:DMT family transporter [Acinetobacter apis]|uniref:Permease of the drug/metabolite transporter (DMT) superfamily n=1 Tax=Acinetobacter apis TaxID=1229165 RepID=A0A217EGQ4_9GAMM|nr:DMT family transporter [Acinetobacter apis]SNQ29502.1 Permease of the drug/metabolite transporter (DMT) superfamily [Acinetobacter apis]
MLTKMQIQGYFYVFLTMCIWGGFTIFSRLNASWNISAWDIVAIRFSIGCLILLPVLLWRKETAFLWHIKPFILGLLGGVAYCVTTYSAFLYVPAAHAAIFLTGAIPLTTAIMGYILFRQAFDRHTWLSLAIMLTALSIMSVLLYQQTGVAFSLGDGLFFLAALWWGTFTVLVRKWKFSAWQSMNSIAIWSTIIYLPIYLIFIPKHFHEPSTAHLVIQGVFHGVFMMIIGTLTYVAAIERLGAFRAGSIIVLAPFIAAVAAIPLLGEPLNVALICGLIGMAIGALQPWRWLKRNDPLQTQLDQKK